MLELLEARDATNRQFVELCETWTRNYEGDGRAPKGLSAGPFLPFLNK